MQDFQLKKQKGFSILAIILVIVAVVVAIGVWALSGQTNTSNSSTSSADIQAAAIAGDASAIKSAYDALLVSGANAANIGFVPNTASTTAVPNMLDPTTGIQVPKPNSNAIKTTPAANDGIWVYNASGFVGNSVGTATADPIIAVGGIKDSVCMRINNTIYGSSTIPASGIASITTGATAAAPVSAAAFTPIVTVASGWTSGCLTTTAGADNNFYFRVLKVN